MKYGSSSPPPPPSSENCSVPRSCQVIIQSPREDGLASGSGPSLAADTAFRSVRPVIATPTPACKTLAVSAITAKHWQPASFRFLRHTSSYSLPSHYRHGLWHVLWRAPFWACKLSWRICHPKQVLATCHRKGSHPGTSGVRHFSREGEGRGSGTEPVMSEGDGNTREGNTEQASVNVCSKKAQFKSRLHRQNRKTSITIVRSGSNT